MEGGVGIFGFADLANVWFGFSVFAFENCGFSVCGFLEFSYWFSVFVHNEDGFSGFFFQSFYGFSGFAKEFTSCSHAKTGVIPRTIVIALHPSVLLEEWMTNLVCLAAVIWVLTEKVKIPGKIMTSN